MTELFKKIASIQIYQLYNITEDTDNKSIRFSYKSIIRDVEVKCMLDNKGLNLKIDLTDIYSICDDTLKLLSKLDYIDEGIKKYSPTIKLVGNNLYIYSNGDIEELLKSIDKVLVYICYKLTDNFSSNPIRDNWEYPGIYIKNGRYIYFNKYDIAMPFMYNNRLEKFAEYNVISGLAGFYVTEKDLCSSKVYSLNNIEEFFVLNTNILYSLIRLKEYNINNRLTLKINEYNIISIMNKRKRTRTILGKLNDDEFYFKLGIDHKLEFTTLINLSV